MQSRRFRVADSVENWAAQPLLTKYRRGWYRTGDAIARVVQQLDRLELDKREKQRSRASGAYKGNAAEIIRL